MIPRVLPVCTMKWDGRVIAKIFGSWRYLLKPHRRAANATLDYVLLKITVAVCEENPVPPARLNGGSRSLFENHTDRPRCSNREGTASWADPGRRHSRQIAAKADASPASD